MSDEAVGEYEMRQALAALREHALNAQSVTMAHTYNQLLAAAAGVAKEPIYQDPITVAELANR